MLTRHQIKKKLERIEDFQPYIKETRKEYFETWKEALEFVLSKKDETVGNTLNWKYTIAWAVWIVSFLIIELIAVFNSDKGDTLSEHIWEWFDIKDPGPFYKTKRLLLFTGVGWLAIHLLTGGWM